MEVGADTFTWASCVDHGHDHDEGEKVHHVHDHDAHVKVSAQHHDHVRLHHVDGLLAYFAVARYCILSSCAARALVGCFFLESTIIS